MARRTYVPKAVDLTHNLTMYLVRNNAKIRAAIAATDAAALPEYDAAVAALQALDAFKEILRPLLP